MQKAKTTYKVTFFWILKKKNVTGNTFCRTRGLSNATFSFGTNKAQRDVHGSSTSKNAAVYKNFIKIGRFLSRVSILTRDIDIAKLSVCLSISLSVRLLLINAFNILTSVTFRYQMKTA